MQLAQEKGLPQELSGQDGGLSAQLAQGELGPRTRDPDQANVPQLTSRTPYLQVPLLSCCTHKQVSNHHPKLAQTHKQWSGVQRK